MISGGRDNLVRRIVISLNATHESRFALDIGANLAAIMNAELSGLFIEDVNLFNLAELPFAREISFGGGLSRTLDPGRLSREIERHASQCRRRVSALAGKSHIPWSFDVRRGNLLDELTAFSSLGDILVFAGGGFGPVAVENLHRSAMEALREHARPSAIVITNTALKERVSGPVILVLAGDNNPNPAAIRMAARIASSREAPLLIYCIGNIPDDVKEFEQEIRSMIDPDARLLVGYLPRAHPEELRSEITHARPQFLILESDGDAMVEDVNLSRYIRTIRCPLMLLLPERAR